jgi:predicted Fe-Mo cluster-binding NifX family protein
MKKVLLTLTEDKKHLSAHFGTCGSFLLLEVEDNQVKSRKEVENEYANHHSGCQVPDYIKSMDVDVVITGGMGMKAVEKCNMHNMEVILGHTGTVDEIIERYLKGELDSIGSACSHHH